VKAGGQGYVDDGRIFRLRFAPVKDLLTFAKVRQKTKTDNK
jgi:hypothetical protein